MARSRSFNEYVSKQFYNEIFNLIASYIEEVGHDDFDRLGLRLHRIHQIGDFELT